MGKINYIQSNEEDYQLIELVKKNGAKNWSTIARNM